MIALAAGLRPGETRVDHADPKAPVQGPLTIGMLLLAPLTYDQLCCLRGRAEVARADIHALRMEADYLSERYEDLGALRADIRDLEDEASRSAPAIIAADYERSMAAIGGAR